MSVVRDFRSLRPVLVNNLAHDIPRQERARPHKPRLLGARGVDNRPVERDVLEEAVLPHKHRRGTLVEPVSVADGGGGLRRVVVDLVPIVDLLDGRALDAGAVPHLPVVGVQDNVDESLDGNLLEDVGVHLHLQVGVPALGRRPRLGDPGVALLLLDDRPPLDLVALADYFVELFVLGGFPALLWANYGSVGIGLDFFGHCALILKETGCKIKKKVFVCEC